MIRVWNWKAWQREVKMGKITESKMQFKNPVVEQVSLKRNKDFNKEAYEGMSVYYNIDVPYKESNSATMVLDMQIGEKGEKAPFYMEISISAEFFWQNEVEGMSESLLKRNGVLLLLSYARPFISHLTVDAGFNPFNIPFVDLREDIKKM